MLEEKLEDILKEASKSSETTLLDDRHDCCRVFVVAKRDRAHDSTPVLFRSYSVDGTQRECSILEAARATCAAPIFFPPVSIGLNTYVDGGIGYNNPSGEAVREAHRIWPSRDIGCLVSIGIGKTDPISGTSNTVEQFGSVIGGVMKRVFPLTAEKLTIASYCTKLITSCEAVHLHLLENSALQRGKTKERYYRFNVPSGIARVELHEWKEFSLISQITDGYLDHPSEKRRLQDCVTLLCADDELAANIGQ